ncbi:hypothetical protein KC669_02315 [Candidatus Dojkabacteria bacterium]|uniref:Uncharacterized protein n=1 Tax=Candidatus Dojkabacteria bacterium TaxID=2099670 RepID=A0A955RM01_9BACT|nr:hypothetical protein [Candidatus Dojkabacteria bacterium]
MEEEEKNHHRSITCRLISCFFLLIIFFCCALFFIITAYRPPSIWNGIVEFSNKDVELKKESDISFEEAKEHIGEQVTAIGENKVIIEEDYLTALAKEGFNGFKDLTVNVEEGHLDLFWALESSIPNNPLIAQIRVGTDSSGDVVIQRLGTPRVSVPRSVNQLLTTAVIKLLNSEKNDTNNKSIIGNLLSVENDTSIEKINFRDGFVELTININVNLYD